MPNTLCILKPAGEVVPCVITQLLYVYVTIVVSTVLNAHMPIQCYRAQWHTVLE